MTFHMDNPRSRESVAPCMSKTHSAFSAPLLYPYQIVSSPVHPGVKDQEAETAIRYVCPEPFISVLVGILSRAALTVHELVTLHCMA